MGLPLAYGYNGGPLNVTGIASFENGSAAAPSITFASDPNTGFYRVGADTVGLATNGVLRVSVSTSLVTLASGMGLTMTAGSLIMTNGRASITNTDTASQGLYVDSRATAVMAVLVEGNFLTDGSVIHAYSDSPSTNVRSILNSVNDNAAATGAVNLRMQQDAANGFANFVATAAANTTAPISTLTTSGATTHHIQAQVNGVKGWIAFSTNNPS